MTRVYGVAALSMLLAGFLAACSGEKAGEKDSDTSDLGKPLVYVSNYPLQYFAEKISEPLVEVRLPVPAGQDPAFWRPTVDDIMMLQKADLIILNGASYESWLKDVSLPTARLVDTSAGFKAQFIAGEEVTTHSHGLEGEHEHSAIAFTTWLDLALAIEQARAIKDAFSERWPEHARQFDSQFGRLAQELAALDGHIKDVTTGAERVPVVFSHPVYQYLVRRYGLEGRSVHWEPGEMPSDDMWQNLATLRQSYPTTWMIWEAQPSPDIAARLAAMGIESVVVDPCASAPNGGDFAAVMEKNTEALKTVYGQP